MFTLGKLSVVAMLIVVTCAVASAQTAGAPAAAVFCVPSMFDSLGVQVPFTS